MNCTEVFTYRQYSNATLQRLHDDLQKARNKCIDQRSQLARCREEMERRGMIVTNHQEL